MEGLIGALNNAGINIIPDFSGKFIRNQAQYCKGQSFFHGGKEYQIAWYGDFKTGEKGIWRSWINKTDAELSAKIDQATNAALAQQREAKEKLQRERALEIEAEFRALPEGGELPPYLRNKRINSLFGAKLAGAEEGAALVVPLLDYDGKIWNVQLIFSKKLPDGTNKKFQPGARKKGLFYTLETPPGFKKVIDLIYVCEGFATSASVQMALGNTALVVCAFDAGNLPIVAANLKIIFPTSKILICADDDSLKEQKANDQK
jgi:putative DNA primase/helicase